MLIKPITSSVEHGEGPHWDHDEQVLYFVDAFDPALWRWEPKQNKCVCQKLDGGSVGVLIPIKNEDGKFLVCQDRSIRHVSWDAERNDAGTSKDITSVDESKPNNQFNDGKVDSRGRLWIGTLTRNRDLSVAPRGGSLYVVSKENLRCPVEVLKDVSISNGIAWSKDNGTMFHIDSSTRTVVGYDFDELVGAIHAARVVFDLGDHDLAGIPDGMTIDKDDNLWVALFGGKSVIKINPTTGKLLEIVEMPATYVTSVAFGGPDFDVLYVTTSKLKLKNSDLIEEPLAGSVFAVYGLGGQGLPANKFEL